MKNFSTGTRFTSAGVEGIHTVTSVKGGIVHYTDPNGIKRKSGESVMDGFVSHNLITIVEERAVPEEKLTIEEFVVTLIPGDGSAAESLRLVVTESIRKYLAYVEA